MKKTFLVLLITLLATLVFAFPAGTFNLGGNAGFTTYKANSDAKASNTIYFNPNIGYLFMDNVSADVLLGFSSNSHNKATSTSFDVGLGARYFLGMGDNKLYAGLGAIFGSHSYKFGSVKTSDSGTHLNAKLGFLVPVTPDVFLDLGAKYEMGMGDYKDNTLGINLGLQMFTPLF